MKVPNELQTALRLGDAAKVAELLARVVDDPTESLAPPHCVFLAKLILSDERYESEWPALENVVETNVVGDWQHFATILLQIESLDIEEHAIDVDHLEDELALLAMLPALRQLNLNFPILSLDRTFPAISQLAALEADGVGLKELGEEIGSLYALEDLLLTNNALLALPQSLNRLTSLRELNVSGNKISTFPEALWALPDLTTIVFNNNALSGAIPAGAKKSKVRFLRLSNNALEDIAAVAELVQLTHLEIDGNPISTFPPSLNQLRFVQLSSDHVRGMWPALQASIALKEVRILGGEQLLSFDRFGDLGSLEALVAIRAPIESLDGLEQAAALRRLDVRIAGGLNDLSPIFKLTELVELQISYLAIHDLPDLFDQLPHLKKVTLNGLPATELPPTLLAHKGITYLDVMGTTLSPPLREQIHRLPIRQIIL
jgi:Leucine rich repeat